MIECAELTKVYGEGTAAFQALRGVSFSIKDGEFVAITGPSGCGKSTLMHLLGLLAKPTSGKLAILGHPAEHLSDADSTRLRRKSIGFVFQAFNLLVRHSALENVCLPMGYAGVGRVERELRAVELLDRVGLSTKVLNTPLELSGGERQRVGIARALANNPGLLLADEPTGNLDSKSSVEIISLFRELNKEGMTVVLVTHDIGIAKNADRVIRLKDGKLDGGHG
ncbi:MAG: ABC transporter ATP-binding protein [Elusimicrobia bacterium]|nr:ABC transporter ATP-binding protein [Elusimicrobiota bacterium]